MPFDNKPTFPFVMIIFELSTSKKPSDMIFFGTRGVKSTIKQGHFPCPQCATNRAYKHKKVTKFFTLYFIPIIPLGKAGEYVECLSCKGTFVTRVLDYNPNNQGGNAFQSVYEEAIRHSMILMMLADGIIDEQEMIMVQKIINKFGHNDISRPELEMLVAAVQRKKEPVDTYLSKITPSLNKHGKEMIIKCGIAVALADNVFDETEKVMIQDMARAMEMPPSRLREIIEETTAPQ